MRLARKEISGFSKADCPLSVMHLFPRGSVSPENPNTLTVSILGACDLHLSFTYLSQLQKKG